MLAFEGRTFLEVPAGGANVNGQRWPTGLVTVFSQSSRHLQVSIWSEAFASLVNSLMLAYYRFQDLCRSSTAQDPEFDIDLGPILPEAILLGLRLLLRRCGLVPDPVDGWSSVRPLPVARAPATDSTNPMVTSVHVQAFMQVDPPRRVSALHLFAIPVSDTLFRAPMHALLRLDRVVHAFKRKAGLCTICDGGCRVMALVSLLDWALRYTHDYVGRAHDGLDDDVLDLSRLSGTFTHDAPYNCTRVSFLLVPYMHTDPVTVHDAFAAPGHSCCTFCEKCGVLLGIFDLFVVDLPEAATVPKCNCGMTQFFQTLWTEAGASELPIREGSCHCPRTCPQDHQGCY